MVLSKNPLNLLQAVTFVKARYPNIISVPIYEVVDLVVHLTSRPEKA